MLGGPLSLITPGVWCTRERAVLSAKTSTKQTEHGLSQRAASTVAPEAALTSYPSFRRHRHTSLSKLRNKRMYSARVRPGCARSHA